MKKQGKIRIVILGIGGVGGYFGGLLAKAYEKDPEVEIVFIARGPHLKKIKQDGLRVLHGDKEFLARPAKATDQAVEVGLADFVLVSTKSYHLETALEQLKPCIGPKTVILPLLNGVDASERTANRFLGTQVWKGCVYIIARLKEAGLVENSGNIQQLHFGLDGETNPNMLQFKDLLQGAGIETYLSSEISKVIWEKYIFISSVATSTAYFDDTIGAVLAKHEAELKRLIGEVSTLARTKKIAIDVSIETKVLDKLKTLPYEATSSMHSDFSAAKPETELGTLTAYVVEEGKHMKVDVTTYETFLKELKMR